MASLTNFCILICFTFLMGIAGGQATDEASLSGAPPPLPYYTSWKVIEIIISILNGSVCLCAFFVIGVILLSKKTRTNGYNVYTSFLLLPDALVLGSYCITRLHSAINNNFGFNLISCQIYNTATIGYYTCNLYLNALVAYEIYTLASRSYARQRVKPITLQKVYVQIFCVYLWGLLFAQWGTLDVYWSYIDIRAEMSCALKYGSPRDGFFTEKWAIVFSYVVFFPPLLYVAFVRFQLWHKKLLPVSGKTRVLSLYFMRIVVVFFCFYLTNIVLISLIAIQETPPTMKDLRRKFWFFQFYYIVCLCQCLVTIRFALTKDDIMNAVKSALGQEVIERKSTKSKVTISGVNTGAATTSAVTSQTPNVESEWEQPDVWTNDNNTAAAQTIDKENKMSPVVEEIEAGSEA